jgi:hypothetical protein
VREQPLGLGAPGALGGRAQQLPPRPACQPALGLRGALAADDADDARRGRQLALQAVEEADEVEVDGALAGGRRGGQPASEGFPRNAPAICSRARFRRERIVVAAPTPTRAAASELVQPRTSIKNHASHSSLDSSPSAQRSAMRSRSSPRSPCAAISSCAPGSRSTLRCTVALGLLRIRSMQTLRQIDSSQLLNVLLCP